MSGFATFHFCLSFRSLHLSSSLRLLAASSFSRCASFLLVARADPLIWASVNTCFGLMLLLTRQSTIILGEPKLQWLMSCHGAWIDSVFGGCCCENLRVQLKIWSVKNLCDCDCGSILSRNNQKLHPEGQRWNGQCLVVGHGLIIFLWLLLLKICVERADNTQQWWSDLPTDLSQLMLFLPSQTQYELFKCQRPCSVPRRCPCGIPPPIRTTPPLLSSYGRLHRNDDQRASASIGAHGRCLDLWSHCALNLHWFASSRQRPQRCKLYHRWRHGGLSFLLSPLFLHPHVPLHHVDDEGCYSVNMDSISMCSNTL